MDLKKVIKSRVFLYCVLILGLIGLPIAFIARDFIIPDQAFILVEKILGRTPEQALKSFVKKQTEGQFIANQTVNRFQDISEIKVIESLKTRFTEFEKIKDPRVEVVEIKYYSMPCCGTGTQELPSIKKAHYARIKAKLLDGKNEVGVYYFDLENIVREWQSPMMDEGQIRLRSWMVREFYKEGEKPLVDFWMAPV